MAAEVAGKNLLQALKATAGSRGPVLSIPVGSPLKALLRPVATRAEALNKEDVRRLTEWRNRFVASFLTEFEATESRTAAWLANIVGPNGNKILFMVDDLSGNTLGYMGLDYLNWEKLYGEADAIVRGGEAPPGLMTTALKTLLAWANNQLGLQSLGVRVRSDNTALEFYRKMGFRDVETIPLRRVENKEGLSWVEDPSLPAGGVSLVHMEYKY